MKKIKLLLMFLILFAGINGCKKDEQEDEPVVEQEVIDENNYTKLTEGTVIVDVEENIETVTDNQIVITTDSEKIHNLKVGQFFVSGRSENAPNGFARKITGISENGNTITFTTEQARMDEIYEEININTPVEIDYENFENFYQRTNDRQAEDNIRPIEVEFNSSTNEFEIKTVLYDADGDYDTETDQIKYEGKLKIIENNSSFIFNIRPSTQKVFNITNEMKFEVTNTIEVSASLEVDREEFTLVKIPLTMTLPTSFVVNVFLEVKIGMEGEISASITLSNETTVESIASLSYDETNGWIYPNSTTSDSTTSFDGDLELMAKLYSGYGLSLEFAQYEDAKASIFLEPYVQFNAESDPNLNIHWDFGYGMELKAETKLIILGSFIDVDIDMVLWEMPYTMLYDGVKYYAYFTDMIPENNSEVDIYPLTFSWQPNDFIAPVEYQIFLGTTEATMVSIGETTDNTFSHNEVLAPGTYYWQIIATEIDGPTIISQSDVYSFDYSYVNVLPTLTTEAVSDITETTATSGGNITDDGGSDITARGVCYSTSPNPTIDDNTTNDGTGTGTFTSNLTGNTTYYVRAYATNSEGTAYGDEVQFTTLAVTTTVPTLTTEAVSDITETTATTGGNITDDGGSDITARGVCYSTSPNPTIDDNTTNDGTGTGTFTSNLTGLTPNTTYYVRAYATNSEQLMVTRWSLLLWQSQRQSPL